MMQAFLMGISLMLMLMFFYMKHPLSMGLILLFQTVLICLISSQLVKSFWFSYILFLVFLGGMLVLFLYVISLASNEMFSFSVKSLVCVTVSSFIFMFLSYFFMEIGQSPENSTDTEAMLNSVTYPYETSFSLMKLYNYPASMITLLVILYLLVTLIAIVKITDLFYGPLRKM
nr:NADH dehydrogenase subunit 6 [Renocera pallida]